MHASRIAVVALATASLVAAGCGSNNTAGTPTSAGRPPTPMQTPRTLTFQLNGAGNPAHGTVRVDVEASRYTITVTVAGLTPDTGHEINIHAGNCTAQDTSLIRHVDHVVADAKGQLTSVTIWPQDYTVPASGLILTLHGNDKTDDAFTHIACADMTN